MICTALAAAVTYFLNSYTGTEITATVILGCVVAFLNALIDVNKTPTPTPTST